MKRRIARAALVLLAAACAGATLAGAAEAVKTDTAKARKKPAAAGKRAAGKPAAMPPGVFATVGDMAISYDQYNAALAEASRKKFYHGKVPEGGLALLQREVADRLVTRVLLLREARRRGLEPDGEEVRRTLEGYEQRYAGSEQWQQQRERVLPALKRQIEEESLLQRLEKSVRDSVAAGPEQAAAYYAAHPDKFTEPEQLDLKVILLKVDPSSPNEAWEKTEKEAQELLEKLRGGADFAELARQRSGDPESAAKGGDLGYRHTGMLPDEVVAALGSLKPGELSAPVRMLQGYAIFFLADRKAPKLVDFEASKERAQRLVRREQGDAAWEALKAGLKKKTPPKIDESRWQPLPDAAAASAPGASPTH